MQCVSHEQEVSMAFIRACAVLRMRDFSFRAMRGREAGGVNTKRAYILGHTSLKNKTVTIDIYTAKKRKPKKVSAILAVIAHELAHHQKPPYRERFRGHWINRIHFPAFYRHVNTNIARFKKDAVLGKYYTFH